MSSRRSFPLPRPVLVLQCPLSGGLPMASDPLDEARPDASERRRHPRFPAHQRLVGYLTSPRLPVHVRDVGLGGFCVETVDPLEPGVVQTVRFTTVDDWSAMLPARSLHCRPSVAAD